MTRFQNLADAIRGISKDEKLDRFVSRVKIQARLEVLKAGEIDFNAATKVAPNVSSAVYGAGIFMRYVPFGVQPSGEEPWPMKSEMLKEVATAGRGLGRQEELRTKLQSSEK